MKNLEELKKLFKLKGYDIGEVNIPNNDKPGCHTQYYIGRYTQGEHYTLEGLNSMYELFYK